MKSNETKEHEGEQRRYTQYVYLLFLATPFTYSIHDAL